MVYSVLYFDTDVYSQKIDEYDTNDYDTLEEIPNPDGVGYLSCAYNNLTQLPGNIGEMFPRLRVFDCSNNCLTHLPERMNWPLLCEFYCDYNNLTRLPLCIIKWRELSYIAYEADNEIELCPQLVRFLRKNVAGSAKHTLFSKCDACCHAMQKGDAYVEDMHVATLDRIAQISICHDVPKFNARELKRMILAHPELSCAAGRQFIGYIKNQCVHEVLYLTLGEVFWYVLQGICCEKINLGGGADKNKVMGALLNEMATSECKCLTDLFGKLIGFLC